LHLAETGMDHLTILERLKLGLGKVRRMYLHMLNRDYVRKNHARRKGECSRCGACCKLMFKCPYLEEVDGRYSCKVHGTRWENCRIFPVDERDLKDRGLINKEVPCGYTFDPPRPPQRWIAILLAASLSIAAGMTANAADGTRKKAKPAGPTVIAADFAADHAPAGWIVLSGTWKGGNDGFACTADGKIAGYTNKDALPLRDVDARIEVWGAFRWRRSSGEPAGGATKPASVAPALTVTWGGLVGGLLEADAASVFVGLGDIADARATRADRGGEFRFTLTVAGRYATAQTGRSVRAVARDVFGAWGHEPIKQVVLSARAGTVIKAVRLTTTPAKRGAHEMLADADALYLKGEPATAAIAYAKAGNELALTRFERAQAAYKLGVCLRDSNNLVKAVEVWELVRALDPDGPWCERVLIELGFESLKMERAALALQYAKQAVRCSAPGIEDWGRLQRLIAASVNGMFEGGIGSQASHELRMIAERLQWAGELKRRTGWVWGRCAGLLEARGLMEDAAAARKRADRLLGIDSLAELRREVGKR